MFCYIHDSLTKLIFSGFVYEGGDVRMVQERSDRYKVMPTVYDWESEDDGHPSIEDMSVSREQMEAWDRQEYELQEEEAFRYTCPCCTNRRLEQHPRIETENDTLRTRTYPITLQDDEDVTDVFSRDDDADVVNFDYDDLLEHGENGRTDRYFRRVVQCSNHESEAVIEYVGRGEGRINRDGLKALLTSEQ